MHKTGVFEQIKKNKTEKILSKLGNNISNINDLTAGEEPSLLFYFLADKFAYLLENNPDRVISEKGVKVRKFINPIIKKLGPLFLKSPQVIENRKKLINPDSEEQDSKVDLPNEPVIWLSNHSFADDILATTITANRHAYILLASLPQIYNTPDGITSWLNGEVLMNRKVKESRHSLLPKAKKVMDLGTDVILFPEGVWNKSPNSLVLNLWPGIYRLAKEKNTAIVPIIHYIEDPTQEKEGNVIHTVIDDPIKIGEMSEEEALLLLREKMGTWYYLMMERYGQSTREQLLDGFENATEAWEHHLEKLVATAALYDKEIELSADYRPPKITNPEMVFDNIANIDNITPQNKEHVEYAKKLVKTRAKNDFQRRF